MLAAALLLLPGIAAAQSLSFALKSAPSTSDPLFHNRVVNNSLAANIFDRLVHQDERQQLVPGLATAWRAIGDNAWEFTLRPGVRFQDGSPFGAEDVAATLARIPRVPNSPSAFTISTRAIRQVEIVDAHTIRLHTEGPAPLLPNDLAIVNIISRQALAASTADFNNAAPATIGTGPFRLIRFTPNEGVVLQRFDGHWGEAPAWRDVRFRFIANDAARVAALLAGDVDAIENVPTEELARLSGNPAFRVSSAVSNRILFLALDHARAESPQVTDAAGRPLPANPLRDLRVRQAISKAIDRQGIAERIFLGEAEPAGGLIAEGFGGASPELRPEPFDPEAARALLRQAGYPEGFTLVLHGSHDQYPNAGRVLQAIGAMLTRVGIRARVELLPAAIFNARSAAPHHDYGVMLLGWGAGTGEVSSPLRALLASVDPARGLGSANRGRYANPALDALLQQALRSLDGGAREGLLRQASALAVRDLGVVPLYYQRNAWATRAPLRYAARADEYSLARSVRPAAD
ncbi:ABC transporter substrate-binding protein [Roseomonas sp. 18066]|uniref:ABC transporter substrate-binding protein n=1 Tax=Roseomonas sp. 18066 TaxID=2681412 RepID=UPI00135A031B|nr:ABC transporter substrate-binding protein [Roseomonas sp. 18066]